MSFAALHEVQDLAAELFVRRVEGEDLRSVIVLLHACEAGTGCIALAQAGPELGAEDVEARKLELGDHGEYRNGGALADMRDGGTSRIGRRILAEIGLHGLAVRIVGG